MSARVVTIVQTGVANTASIIAAFKRLDAQCAFASTVEEVRSAESLVLPGVGAFAPGMGALREQGLDEALRERIERNARTLAVCLGFQLLCATSEESPGVSGLGIFPVAVQRFPSTVRVPQLGWNTVTAAPECRLLASGAVYFANSFRISDPLPNDWRCATADYAGSFIAAAERGQVLACQFHPELSGRYGHELLGRWLNSGPQI